MNVNVLYVQVRRRGDAFYLDGSEPAPEGVAIDERLRPARRPARRKARAAGIEVHALVTLGPVWHLGTAPSDARHVFTRHGFQGGRAVEGAENWLTRTLQPDGNGTSMDGYRFGNDYWLDFGHPAAANYVVDLVTRLVERYPVDGVRLDALHYPEAPSGTASVGYNAVAVARFQARTGQPGVPGQDDAPMERVASRADHRADASAGGLGLRRSAFARRQRVRGRGRRGSRRSSRHGGLHADVPGLVPMGGRRQRRRRRPAGLPRRSTSPAPPRSSAAGRPGSAANTGARPFVVGLGAYQNSLEGLLPQARVGLAAAGPQGGVSFFSLAATNAPVVNNPLSSPPGRDTPQRAFEDVASALRTGRTTGGQVVDPVQPPLFAVSVPRAGDAVEGQRRPRARTRRGRDRDAGGRRAGPARCRGPLRRVRMTSSATGRACSPRRPSPPGAYRVQVVSPAGGAFTSDCTVDVSAQQRHAHHADRRRVARRCRLLPVTARGDRPRR